jgi:hypothetical protein
MSPKVNSDDTPVMSHAKELSLYQQDAHSGSRTINLQIANQDADSAAEGKSKKRKSVLPVVTFGVVSCWLVSVSVQATFSS